jgi:hypothetical protein
LDEDACERNKGLSTYAGCSGIKVLLSGIREL